MKNQSGEHPFIKICGITRAEDAQAAEKAGAEFTGFIFVKDTPRYISPEDAAPIIAGLARAKAVGVCMNQSTDEMNALAEVSGVALLQLHGDESPEQCRGLRLPVIKAFRIKNGMSTDDVRTMIAPFREIVRYFLFDTYDKNQAGGTGRTFNWEVLKGLSGDIPFFLAGGLGPDNVKEAASLLHPFALDISSGVEIEPGRKDHAKIARTISEVPG